MMKLRKALAPALAASLVLAACGGDDDTATDTTDATDESEDTAATEDTAADEGDDEMAEEEAPEETTADDDEMAEEEAPEETTAEDTVDASQGSDLTFHMITHSDDGPFWTVVKRGADAAAEDLGIEVVWQGSNNDPEAQVQLIEQAISEGSDGIASSLPSPDQLVGPLTAAADGGTPVVTLNSGVDQYQEIGALTHVGQTEFIAGQGAGERFNELGVTKILCGVQEQSNVALDERCGGLADTFSGEVVVDFMGLDADTTAQENTISAALQADPDIDGFMGTGPVIAMSGLRASEALGRDIQVAGFDITTEILDAIGEASVAFTVDQQQYLQGYLSVLFLYLNVTNGNTVGGGLPVLTGPGFVDTDNADSVAALVEAGTR